MLNNLLLLFIFQLLFNVCIEAGNQPNTTSGMPEGFPSLAELGQTEMPQLTDDQIKEMLKVLEELPQDVLDEFAQAGEALMKQAEEEGLNPYELLGIPSEDDLQRIIEETQQEVEPEITPTTTEDIVATETPTDELKKVSDAQIKKNRVMIKEIISFTESILDKSQTERQARLAFERISFALEDFIYYLNVLTQKSLVPYLFTDQFQSLLKTLKSVHEKVQKIEQQVELLEEYQEANAPYHTLGLSPSASWQDTNKAYQDLLIEHDPERIAKKLKEAEVAPDEIQIRMQQARDTIDELEEAYTSILERERAMQALHDFAQMILDVTQEKQIIEQIKSLLKQHEPALLKKRKMQEEKEARARKQQQEVLRRQPPFTPTVTERPAPKPISRDESPISTPSTPFTPTPSKTNKAEERTLKPTMPQTQGGQTQPSTKVEKETAPKKNELKKSDGKPAVPQKPIKEKKEEKLEGKLGKRLENVEKEIRELSNYITKPGAMTSEGLSPSPAQNFKDLTTFLPQSMPADKDAADFKRTKNLRKHFEEMSKTLTKINNEFNNLDFFASSQQKLFMKEVKEVILKYDFQKHMKELLNIYIDNKGNLYNQKNKLINIDSDKDYILRGRGTPSAEVIKNANKDATNPMGEFYQALRVFRHNLRLK